MMRPISARCTTTALTVRWQKGHMVEKRPHVKRTLRPREEWIPISVPSIIDLETFHQAGMRGKDNQKFSPRNLQEPAYLLRKLVHSAPTKQRVSTNLDLCCARPLLLRLLPGGANQFPGSNSRCGPPPFTAHPIRRYTADTALRSSISESEKQLSSPLKRMKGIPSRHDLTAPGLGYSVPPFPSWSPCSSRRSVQVWDLSS